MSLETRRPMALTLAAVLAVALSAAAPALGQEASPSVAPGTSTTPGATADECIEPEASAPPVPDETLAMPEAYRIQLFEGVHGGIRDFYVDPETNGLDWEGIGDDYARLIIGTDNAYEVYDLLSEMVGLLEDPYTNFYAPEDLGDPETFDPSYGGIGALLDTSAAGEDSAGLRILYVFEGGSAKEAGIDARDRIVGVNGDPCARIADIRGPAGTDVTLTIVSPGEEPRDVVLERRQIDPTILPESRRLEADPTVGYLRLPSLAGQQTIDAAEQALTRFVRGEDAIEGLVIDVRATAQGAPGVIIEILRTFVEGQVGEFHSRVSTEPIEIEPDGLAEAYASMPLVILVDEGSEAEAEQLAAILQDQGRATVVGEQTPGLTHGANNVDFPDGSLLQIVSFGFQLPDGQTLEGQGVTPDVVVDADWLDFPAAEDPGVLAALEVIAAERDAAVAAASGSPEASAAPDASAVVEPSVAPLPSRSPSPGASPSPEPVASPSPSPEASASAAPSASAGPVAGSEAPTTTGTAEPSPEPAG